MKIWGKYVWITGIILFAGIFGNSLTNGTPSEVWVDDDWAGSSYGDTVDGHTFGYDAFATIQDGIDAVAEEGIVHVADGTYQENIVIDKPLTLINSSKPVIDGQGGYAINITANNVSIIGFNITNSSYGIYCNNASGFYIANNTFWYNIRKF